MGSLLCNIPVVEGGKEMKEEIGSAFGHTDPTLWVWNEAKQRYDYVGPNRAIIGLQVIFAWVDYFLWSRWHKLTDRFRDEEI